MKKKIFALSGVVLLAVSSITGAILFNSNKSIMIRAQSTYTCCDVTFGAYSKTTFDLYAHMYEDNIYTPSQLYGTVTGFNEEDLTFTERYCVNIGDGYGLTFRHQTNAQVTPCKIVINSTKYTFDRVIIYAQVYPDKSDGTNYLLRVNKKTVTLPCNSSYDYQNPYDASYAYTVDFENTNQITIVNGVLGDDYDSIKNVIVVNKIVFRCYPV